MMASLRIGVPSIDKEHAELVAQLNALARLPDAVPDTERFSEILSQLGQQINAHFNSEENAFRSAGLPAIEMASHIQAHTDILDQYSRLNLDLIQGKTFSRGEVILMIKSWILDHIEHHDLKLIPYRMACIQEQERDG
jgi:hemerythrin